MAGGETPHRASEKQSESRFVQLFSSSRDILCSDNEFHEVSETHTSEIPHVILTESEIRGDTSETFSKEELAPPPGQSISLDSISEPEKDLSNQMSYSEQMEVELPLPAGSGNSLPVSELQLEQINLNKQPNFPELVFALGYTGEVKQPTLTVTRREIHNHSPFGLTSRIHLVIKGSECLRQSLAVRHIAK